MFSTYSPVVYGDDGLITITMCALYISKFKPTDVSNPTEYRAHGSSQPFILLCYFGVCVCVCVCVGEIEREREMAVNCEDSIGQLCATPFWHRYGKNHFVVLSQRWCL